MKIVLLLCVLCGLASADEKAAKKYFDAGAKAYAAQNFEAAAAYFDQAYKEQPMPEIAFSAAQAYRRLYRVQPEVKYVRRAVVLYRAYLDKVKTGGRVGDASDNLGEMERELDKLESQGKLGKIRPEVTVERTRIGITITKGDQATPDAGALREIGEGIASTLVGVTAKLDGKPIDPFALVDVEPGDHVISVTANGYFPVEKTQRAVAGAPVIVEVELRPRPAHVKIATESGAKISVDGRPSGTTMLDLATGKHVITVMRRGRLPFGRELSVMRGQEVTIDARLQKTGRRRAVPWVLGGAGALTVLSALTGIAAVVADGKAIDARHQIASGNASPAIGDNYDDQIKRRDELKTSAIVLGAGAVVAGAIGLGLYLFDVPSRAKIESTAEVRSVAKRLELAPVVGRGTAGVSATGRF